MRPLQYAGLWRVLSVLLVLVVLAGTLAPAFWFDSRAQALAWFAHSDKWMHGVTFLVLSVWFAGLAERRSYWRVAAALIAFGLVIEGAQYLVGYRSADWLDMAANTAGIIAGLTAAIAGLGGWSLWVEDRYSRLRQR